MDESTKKIVEDLANKYFVDPGPYEKLLVQNIFLAGMLHHIEIEIKVTQ